MSYMAMLFKFDNESITEVGFFSSIGGGLVVIQERVKVAIIQ